MKNLKNIRLSLIIKLLVAVLVAAGVIYLLTIRYINYDFKEVAIQDAKTIAHTKAQSIGNEVVNSFNEDFDYFRTYATIFEQFDKIDSASFRNFFNKALEKALLDNPKYVSAWDNWELRFVVDGYTLPYGRVSNIYYREGDYVLETVDSLDLYGDDTTSLYYRYKSSKKEGITEPYYDSFSGSDTQILMTSIITPVLKGEEFVGMVGADISLQQMTALIDSMVTDIDGHAYMMSNKGTLVAHPNPEYLGKKVKDIDSVWTVKNNVLEKIQAGEQNDFISTYEGSNGTVFTSVVPIKFGHSDTYWAIAIDLPLKHIIEDAQSHFEESREVGWWGLLALAVITLLVAFQIIRPIKITTRVLQNLAEGNIKTIKNIHIKTGDEIEQMSKSVNTVAQGFKNTSEFANQIKQGNFNYEFSPLSDKDMLGNAVLEMRNSLKNAEVEEMKRKQEDEQNNWASHGINLFSNILRQDNDNLNKLGMRIISQLVEYLDAHQGGIYLAINDRNDQHLELLASIGFDKDKKTKTTIEANEGPVGRCLLEKEKIFIDDVPDEFSPVTSGLGKSKPSSVLIVPMLINEEVVGILEIESLKKIERYQINFVEKIAVSIASTISSAKINSQTSELLKESEIQADELAQQEEEMRQNMEELQAMQEEARKREDRMINFLDAVKTSILYIEYDMEANITNINDNMLQLFQLKRDQIVGKPVGSYDFSNRQAQKNYDRIWALLKEGKPAENHFHTKYLNKEYFLHEYYQPIFNDVGQPYKVINIAIDESEDKRKEKQLEELKEKYTILLQKQEDTTVKEEKEKISINEVLSHQEMFEYIDLSHLQKVYKDDLRKIQNIIKIYIETIPGQIKELEKFDKNNLSLLKAKVNTFKTKMTYLGLDKIQDLAKELETICATGVDIENMDDIIVEINHFWTLASEELKQIALK
eukprot:Anaeramoba_ignava/a1402_11.p1 GENE.a1402_11~~a1402_11.p1  ORF type:complete len:928 (-),score=94.81 a1402_11:635-3418(-)